MPDVSGRVGVYIDEDGKIAFTYVGNLAFENQEIHDLNKITELDVIINNVLNVDITLQPKSAYKVESGSSGAPRDHKAWNDLDVLKDIYGEEVSLEIGDVTAEGSSNINILAPDNQINLSSSSYPSDVKAWDDILALLDIDTDSTFIFGSSAYVLKDDAFDNAELTAGKGLVIKSSDSDTSYVVMAVDTNNFCHVRYDKSEGRAKYVSYLASTLTGHDFSGELTVSNGDISAETGDINVKGNTKKILFTGTGQQIGTSTANYPSYVFANRLRYKVDCDAFDNLDDLQIIMDMYDPETGEEHLPELITDEHGWVAPGRDNKLIRGGIRQLTREQNKIKEEIKECQNILTQILLKLNEQ